MEIVRSTSRSRHPDATRTSLKILLVEDDQPLAGGIASALESDGHVIKTLHDGKSALEEIERTTFDLLILDIGLPGIDGFEVLRHVRADGFGLPVLLLTARDAIEARVHGLESGADDYLIKPCALLEVSARVRDRATQASARPRRVVHRAHESRGMHGCPRRRS